MKAAAILLWLLMHATLIVLVLAFPVGNPSIRLDWHWQCTQDTSAAALTEHAHGTTYVVDTRCTQYTRTR